MDGKPSAPLYSTLISPEELSQLPPPPTFKRAWQGVIRSNGVTSGNDYFQEVVLPHVKVGDEVVWLPRKGNHTRPHDILNRLDIGLVQRVIYHVNQYNESQLGAVVAFHDEVEGGQVVVTEKGQRFVLLVDVKEIQRLGDFLENVNSQKQSAAETSQIQPNKSTPGNSDGVMGRRTYLSRPCVLMHKMVATHPIITKDHKIFNLKLDSTVPTAVRGNVKRLFSNLGELFLGAEFEEDIYAGELEHSPTCTWASNGCDRRVAINIVYLTKNAWDTEFRLFIHNNVVSFEELFQYCPDPAPPSYADALKTPQTPPIASTAHASFQEVSPTAAQLPPLPPAQTYVQNVTNSDKTNPSKLPTKPMSFLEEMQRKLKAKAVAGESINTPVRNNPEINDHVVKTPQHAHVRVQPNPPISTVVPVTPRDKSEGHNFPTFVAAQSMAEKRAMVQKLLDKNPQTFSTDRVRPASLPPQYADVSNCPPPSNIHPCPPSLPLSAHQNGNYNSKRPTLGKKPATLPKPSWRKPQIATKPIVKQNRHTISNIPQFPVDMPPLSANKSFLFDNDLVPTSSNSTEIDRAQKLPTPPPITLKPRLEQIAPKSEEEVIRHVPQAEQEQKNKSKPQAQLPLSTRDLGSDQNARATSPRSTSARPSQPPPPPPTLKQEPPQAPQVPEYQDHVSPQVEQVLTVPIPPQLPPVAPPPPPSSSIPSKVKGNIPDRGNLLEEIRRGTTLRKATTTKDKNSIVGFFGEKNGESSSENGSKVGEGGSLASLLMEAIQHRRFGIEADDSDSEEETYDENDDAWD